MSMGLDAGTRAKLDDQLVEVIVQINAAKLALERDIGKDFAVAMALAAQALYRVMQTLARARGSTVRSPAPAPPKPAAIPKR